MTPVTGYRFDDISIDTRNRQLWREGELLSLNSKYFDVLVLLVREHGQLVEKQRIFDEIWEGVFVTDAALTQCIKDIRKQLGDDASNPRYIKTVPKHGYIFIGDVAEETPKPTHTSPSLFPAGALARPYKFLDYYTEQDARLFFGREREVEGICSRILAHRSFILHGRSGVGKSSLVRAGLMPRLKAAGHPVFALRSFTDPIREVAHALAPVSKVSSIGTEGLKLVDLVEEAGRRSPGQFVILLLDQFEEFFSILGLETKQGFITAIGELFACEALPVRLVFVLREDLLAEMSQFKPSIPEIFHHEYRLQRFNREQASRAIMEPAKVVQGSIEPELLPRLLDDLSDGDSIDPSQLQIVCDSLFDHRDSLHGITLAVYERLGTTRKILAGYLERVLTRFTSRDLELAKTILKTLLSTKGNRLVLRLSDLEGRVGAGAPFGTAVRRLVDELVASRIVRRSSQDGAGWIELAHDCLIPEISRWFTEEDRSLKEARAVIERAMENYRAHLLIPDVETLTFVLPLGARLGLTDEEGDLLVLSCLHRTVTVPEWLGPIAPSLQNLISHACEHNDPEVRQTAIASARYLGNSEAKSLLRDLALRDPVASVRRAATFALADRLRAGVLELFMQVSRGEKAMHMRGAACLALLRDYDRQLVSFSQLSMPVSLLVAMQLVWLRLRGAGSEILRGGLGGALGGAAAGFAGSLMLGAALTIARRDSFQQAASLIFVLCICGALVGAIGALGVSFGMVTATRLFRQHSRWWSVAGGMAGGAVIGGSTKFLGVDALKALFGQNLTGITGAFEGAVIGAGVSLGVFLTGLWAQRVRPWKQILGAAIGAMCAGVLLVVIGGNLFSGSLEILASAFANSRIRLDPLAYFFGEAHFGRTTQITLGAIEGMMFGGGTVAGIEFFLRSRRAVSRPS